MGYTLPDFNLDLLGARGFLLRNGPKGPFTPIEFPGAPRTIALGINDHTAVVGQYERPAPRADLASNARRSRSRSARWPNR